MKLKGYCRKEGTMKENDIELLAEIAKFENSVDMEKE